MASTTTSPRAATVAGAAFVGWLALVPVNATFVALVDLPLGIVQRVLHHLYDSGQFVGLGACSWLIAWLLSRVPLLPRIAAGSGLVLAATYALLGGDLENFIERHPESTAPWQLIFTAVLALCAGAALALGWLVARSERRWRRVRLGAALCLSLGLALAVANHLLFKLDYPGAHFLAAWVASSWIGMSALGGVARHPLPRRVRAAILAASIASLLAYAVPPDSIVRTALLRSTGAVTAPFAAQAWALLRRRHAEPMPGSAAWFRPRGGLPAIPPQELPGLPNAPIVILLTVDALRSDIVELDRHSAAVPNLHAMTETSLSFARTWSPAACTGPTLRQLFLGTYFSQHGAKDERGPFLATLLERGGARTVFLRTHENLARGSGIVEGFGRQRDIGTSGTSRQVVKEVLAELGWRPTGPLFIYSHIMDPHSPYNRGRKKGSAKQRYIAEVTLVDTWIGRLRGELRRRALGDRTYLIVTSDHGEAFYEHGRPYHARTMYEEMIRVPLLIEGPGIQPRRVDRSVSLLDLGPTILSLFGLPTPAHFMGESLVPFMRGETPRLARPLAAENHNKMRAMLFRDHLKAIVDGRTGTEELYDLHRDPRERTNLAEREDAARYFATLYAFFDSMDRPPN